MKIIESHIYYVIYNITREGYFIGASYTFGGTYRNIHNFSNSINDATFFDTRKEANELIKEFISINNIDKYTVKKVKIDYSIN